MFEKTVLSFILLVLTDWCLYFRDYAVFHFLLDFDEPFIYIASSESSIDFIGEGNVFILGGVHSMDDSSLLELQTGYSFKTFFEMRLDFSWIFGFT